MLFLTNHLWLCGVFLVGVTTLIAMAGPIIIRRQVSLEKLSSNNEVAGFKFAVVGVLYAVMLAFAVIVVWEKFNDAEKDVAQEAGAATMIYRLSEGIPAAPGDAIRGALVAYLNAAIADDWPAMEQGTTSPAVTRALNNLYTAVLSFNSGDEPRHGASVGDSVPARSNHPSASGERCHGLRECSRNYLAGTVWRRLRDDWFHLLLRQRKPPSAVNDDRRAIDLDFFCAAHRYRD